MGFIYGITALYAAVVYLLVWVGLPNSSHGVKFEMTVIAAFLYLLFWVAA